MSANPNPKETAFDRFHQWAVAQYAEVRRRQILKECREGLAEYRSQHLKPQTAEETIASLCSYIR